jgi:two-component system OmpR family sensor kinase
VSLRARLLLVLAGLAVVGLLVADVVTYAALRSFLVDRVDNSLATSIRDVKGGPMGERRFIPPRKLYHDFAAETGGLYVEWRDADGTVSEAGVVSEGPEPPTPDLPERLEAPQPGEARLFTVPGRKGGPDFRVRVEPQAFGGALVLAAPLDGVEGTLRRLAAIMIIVSALVVGGMVALGLWLVRVGLRPLRRIEHTAAAIAAGDLSRRIETASPRTEVGRLGRALNVMLGQIEAAFAQRAASERRLRRFLADASHELRTPLSAVRAYAELFERGARDRPDDLERSMAGIGRETRRMGDLVDELLLLARLDQGRPLERVEVDIARVCRDAVDAARALDPGRAVSLEAPDALTVTGDPDRLRQVVDNLLANVRAHTPPGAPATVRAGEVAGDHALAIIEVADTGPGLTEQEAARAFERFYRADPSRARDGAGSGLGLSIVAAIAEAHGGRATVSSTPGAGACFRVELPLGRQEAVKATASTSINA